MTEVFSLHDRRCGTCANVSGGVSVPKIMLRDVDSLGGTDVLYWFEPSTPEVLFT